VICVSICELIYNYFSAKFFRNNCGYTFNEKDFLEGGLY
jgi:hypothetical protein